MRLGAELADALSKHQLQVYYQPQVRLSDGSVAGVEALARWESPVLGAVGPDRFIAVAEEDNLIGEIGIWIIRKALEQVATLQQAVPFRLAVNVSAVQLRDPGFPARVAEILADTSCRGGRLELEITEGSCLRAEAGAAVSLPALRRIGVPVVLDDFGTGYSNLATLGQYEFDRLKLDRGLVAEFCGTSRGRRIIEWSIDLAHGLGMEVIAEGVETEEQAGFLLRAGCDIVQGYLYAPPLPIDDLSAWLLGRTCRI